MIKIRMELDELITVKGFHFGEESGYLAILGECGETIVMFKNIKVPKRPTKKEIEFIKNLVLKDIKKINDTIKKIVDLKKDEPKPVYDYYAPDYRYIALNKSNKTDRENVLYFNPDTYEIHSYKVSGKTIEEMKENMKKLDKLFEDYKKYEKWHKEITELRRSLNKCYV